MSSSESELGFSDSVFEAVCQSSLDERGIYFVYRVAEGDRSEGVRKFGVFGVTFEYGHNEGLGP